MSEERTEITESCGCVFCDLGLEPDSIIAGRPVHMTRDRFKGYSLCTRCASPPHRSPAHD